MKNSLKLLTSRFEKAEETIGEHEDRPLKLSSQKSKKIKKRR